MRGHSASETRVNALVPRASILLREKMDCRVEPGNDDAEAALAFTTRPATAKLPACFALTTVAAILPSVIHEQC
jgi:hypothetical protein